MTGALLRRHNRNRFDLEHELGPCQVYEPRFPIWPPNPAQMLHPPSRT
jgi:hypothetical protein